MTIKETSEYRVFHLKPGHAESGNVYISNMRIEVTIILDPKEFPTTTAIAKGGDAL